MSTTATILVIEDDSALSEALRIRLFEENFAVIVARDGESGLEQALSQQPSAILLDIGLPGLNGMELLEALRQKEWGKSVPVIVLSNQGQPETIVRTLKQRVQAYFIKFDTSLETIVSSLHDLIKT